GDVLVSWSRPPAPPANPQAAQGRIDSPLDVSIVELEQLPRGPVIVAGHRGSSDRTWTLTPVLSLRVTLRPALSEPVRARHEEGRRLVDADKTEAGAALWREAAAQARTEDHPHAATWLVARAAAVLAGARKWPAADAAYDEALRRAEQETPSVAPH